MGDDSTQLAPGPGRRQVCSTRTEAGISVRCKPEPVCFGQRCSGSLRQGLRRDAAVFLRDAGLP